MSPVVGVGAVGVPVKEGEAMVALKAISFVLAVTLEVKDKTAVLSVVMLDVLLVILFVFVVILAALLAISFIFAVILEVFEATEFVNEVILLVFAAILFVLAVTLVFKDVMLKVFVEIFAVLLAISFVFVVMLEVIEAILGGKVAMVAELTPPTLFTIGAVAIPPKSFVN
jgi:hypothetical protein